MKKEKQAKRALPVGIRKAGKSVGIAILVLMLLVLAANISLTAQKYTKPDDVPSIFGISPLFVMSGSMAPAIKLDDLIFFKPVNTDDLKIGDIIIYAPPENSRYVVTHRIVSILYDEDNRRVFLTKGDNNTDIDTAPVDTDQVLGIYFARIPRIGKLVEWFIIRPNGVVICVALPLVLFLVIDLLRRLFGKKYRLSEGEVKDELQYLRSLTADLTVPTQPAQTDDDAQDGVLQPDNPEEK
ncbi:MAG: signal peptidase I [Firmicutes bacterium]|nr:signal peptidase I [Bacillota bacterium]